MIRIIKAIDDNQETIQQIHSELKRPFRTDFKAHEFLIAWDDGLAVGCAATALLEQSGYFYGLAVRRRWQRQGIGGQLMQARLDLLRVVKAKNAVALVMFWNSRFFRSHGFSPIKRNLLPSGVLNHPDLTNPMYKRSSAMVCTIQ